MTNFPSHPDAVTIDWLSELLRGAGCLDDDTIDRLSWEPIGTGQVGDSVRFTLQCSGGSNGTTTLAAKFPAVDPKSRSTAEMMGLYSKEVHFYREFANQLAVRTPKVVAAEITATGDEFILLFEDLGPARIGDQIAGCTIGDAREAIRQAAAIHASSWQNSAMLNAEWIQPPPELNQQLLTMYPQAQAVFRERYANVLEPEFMELCEQLSQESDRLFHDDAPPQCIVHGDFRLDNMLFDIQGGAEPLAVLDWQTVTTGVAMTDIGYFLGSGIGNHLRSAHEDELLDLYLTEMRARGVALSRSDIWHQYRVGALHGVATSVFSAAFVERTERGDANFLSMARGACALALAHDSLAALKEGN